MPTLLGGLVAVAAVVLQLSRHYNLSETYALALVASTAGVGFSIDDPAAETVASSPSTLAQRRVRSATIACAVAAAMWAGIALAVAMSDSQHFPTYDIAIEFVALASIGLATSAFVQRRTSAPGGPTAALVVLVGPVFMAGVVFRDVQVFPSLVPGQNLRERWVWLAAAAGASLAHLSRDPGRV